MSLDFRVISGPAQIGCTAGLSISIALCADGPADAGFRATDGFGRRNRFHTDMPDAQADVDTHGGVAA